MFFAPRMYNISIYLTIKRSDAAKVHLPAEVLTVDLAHVGHVEGILFTGTAMVDVHLGSPPTEDIVDEALGSQPGLRQIVSSMTDDWTIMRGGIIVIFFMTEFCHAYFSRDTRSRCHNHVCDRAHRNGIVLKKREID